MDVTPFLSLQTSPQALLGAAAKRLDAPRYVLPDGGVVTWREHVALVRDAALFTLESGIAPGERALVFGANSVEWISIAIGVQAARGVMVPVYPASTPSQAAYLATHSGARLLFVGSNALLSRVLSTWASYAAVERIVLFDPAPDVAAAVRGAGAFAASPLALAELEKKLVLWPRAREIASRAEASRFERSVASAALSDRAVMLYTSGTTGNPKGVPLTHMNLASNTRDWLVALGPRLAEGDTDLLWLPMSHIFGYGECCTGNLLGWTSHLVAPDQVVARMREVRPEVFMSVPSYWEKLAAAGSLKETTGGRLRFCLSGGAGLKREVKERFFAEGLHIIEGYGLTETSPTLTINRPDAFRFDSVGRPLDTVELELADDGEILARGPNVFGGYHEDPAATAAAFDAEGWFRTGDVGRFTEDGFLQIVDRKKEILVTAGGKNVPPANIELRFKDDPLLDHLVVYGDGKRYLVAGAWPNKARVEAALGRAVELDDPAVHALIAARIEAVNADLASYETIKRFSVFSRPLTVEDGFLTATLKLRRKRVYEAFGASLEALYGS